MRGLSSPVKENISRIVEDLFDKVSLQFIGDIPKLKHKKLLLIGHAQNLGLPHLFVQAMQNRTPNPIEQDALKGLLDSAHGFIDSLKNKTRANLTERLDGLTREARIKGGKINPADVEEAIAEEFSKARSHIQAILESESTKLRNLGSLMDISRVASSIGDGDPSVFFVVVKDDKTCKECVKLHLMPDGVTPRVWKFSELKQGYHKRGEENPSAFGLHPHCRCTLTYLSKGFGFDKKGLVAYKGENHDTYEEQND